MPIFDHRDRATWLHGLREKPLLPVIAPSLLACDFANLLAESTSVLSEAGGSSEWLHVDVMDGHFVPNISIGSGVTAALRAHLPHVFLDCHLMVSHPEQWVTDFAKAGASQYTFHIEATTKPKELIAAIRKAGMQVGVALKPKTPASTVYELCDENLVDMVLVMTVEPGFGGQSFMADMMPKVTELRQRYPLLNIQVDGGLAPSTIDAAATAGANIVVAGTSIFKAPSRKEVTESMRETLRASIGESSKAPRSLL